MGNALPSTGCCGGYRGGPALPVNVDIEFDEKRAGQYKTQKQLGHGASCEVFEAVDPRGQLVALKRMKKPKGDMHRANPTLFRNEVAVMSEVKHPNIVQFEGAFEDKDFYYIASQLCRGGELFDRVSTAKFSEQEASRLTKHMLEGLAAIHAKNIAHRDLKPENYVFDSPSPDSDMKLIDFGCARIAKDREPIADVAGSAYYVAPEVLRPDYKRTGAVWRAADMWSLGVIVFLLVQGFPPFNGRDERTIFKKVRLGKFKFSQKTPVSDTLKDFISKLLKREPGDRMTAEETLRHPWVRDVESVSTKPLDPVVIKGLQSFRHHCELQKSIARLLMDSLMPEDVRKLREVFKRFDADGDGRLDEEELKALLVELGREGDVRTVLKDWDSNHDGLIDFDELQHMYASNKLSDKDEADDAFHSLDVDGSGTVDAEEISVYLSISLDEAKRMIQEIDSNGDGVVDIEEWINAFADKE